MGRPFLRVKSDEEIDDLMGMQLASAYLSAYDASASAYDASANVNTLIEWC